METTRRQFLGLSRSGLVLGGAALAMGVLASCGSGSPGSSGGGTFKVGILVPRSGVFAGFGPGMEHGAQLAVEEVNAAGGIGKRKVELVIADDKSEATTGASQARRLLDQDKVDLLVGTVGSDETLAVLPLVNRAKTTFIYPVDGDDRTCTNGGSGTNEFVFGLGDTPFQRLGKFIPYLVNQKGKNWYLLGNDYVYPKTVLEQMKKYLLAAGGTVVAEQYTPLGTTDYVPIVRKIQDSNAPVVFAVVPGTDGNAFMKQASQAGLTASRTVTGTGTFAAEVYSGMGSFADGAIIPDRYTERLDNAENKAFVVAYRKKFGAAEVIGPAAVTSYASIKLVAQAASAAGSTDAAAIRKAMAGLKMNLPMGPVEIDAATHLLTQHEYVLKVGPGGYEVVADLGMIAPDGHNGCTVK